MSRTWDKMDSTSPIANRWGQVPLIPVQAKHQVLYRGTPGAAYNHHAQITSLDGRLYTTWSNGPTHENEPGQRMMIATSDDGVVFDQHYLLGDEPAHPPRHPGAGVRRGPGAGILRESRF